MCVGENCAPQAARYIKAQLSALYDNAVECIQEHENADRAETLYRSSHALANFFFGKYGNSQNTKLQSTTMFYAAFDKPELDFICNHDVILDLKITKGHFHLDFMKSSNMLSSDSGRVRPITDLQVKFRVGYDIRELSGTDSKIGNAKIRLFVLDLTKAKLISTSPELAGKDALAFYLSKYLDFLQSSGHHVLFSLPEFDYRFPLTIDHSDLATSSVDVDEIYGIAIAKIHTQLSLAWLKSAMLSIDVAGQPIDWNVATLAEYRSTWSSHDSDESGGQFYVKLGAPHIKPVCSREAILYFTIDEVTFYDDMEATVEQEPTRRYFGWEIAFLVEIVCEEDVEGSAIRCKVAPNKYHLREDLCKFHGVDEADDMAEGYILALLDSFADEYFTSLEATDQLVIYDSRWSTHTAFVNVDDFSESEEDISSWQLDTSASGAVNSKIASWRQTITKSDMGGFDQVIAISQASINAHFKNLFNSASSKSLTSSLLGWKSEQQFSTSFRPMKVRLLSNGRAIIWIHLEKGNLKLTKDTQGVNENDKYGFEDWQLAFEVDLKMDDYASMAGIESAGRWKTESLPFKQHGNKEDRNLRHIYLDLRNADFIHEYSRFDDLLQTESSRPIEKLRATIHYLRTQYFTTLAERGLNILHTVPVWTSRSNLPMYALTDVAFHVYSSVNINRQSCSQIGDASEPAIVILGMTDFRPMPDARRLEYSADWVIRASRGVSYGTVGLSRGIFMDRGLLNGLARINATTTVIPLMSPVDENGLWRLRLTTWSRDEKQRQQECQWIPESPEKDGRLRYKWEHHVAFKYEHKGSGVVNGAYAVSCTTCNYVELPPATRSGSLTIKIWGEVVLNVSFASNARKGSAKSSAKWNASLVLQSDPSGIKANLLGSTSPVFEKTQYEGELATKMFTDLESDLKALFPETVNLNDVLLELKQFEGIWQSCYPGMQAYCLANPAFNTRGDLLFELRPHNVSPPSSPISASSDHASAGNFLGGRASARHPRVFNGAVRGNRSRREASIVGGGYETGLSYARSSYMRTDSFSRSSMSSSSIASPA